MKKFLYFGFLFFPLLGAAQNKLEDYFQSTGLVFSMEVPYGYKTADQFKFTNQWYRHVRKEDDVVFINELHHSPTTYRQYFGADTLVPEKIYRMEVYYIKQVVPVDSCIAFIKSKRGLFVGIEPLYYLVRTRYRQFYDLMVADGLQVKKDSTHWSGIEINSFCLPTAKHYVDKDDGTSNLIIPSLCISEGSGLRITCDIVEDKNYVIDKYFNRAILVVTQEK